MLERGQHNIRQNRRVSNSVARAICDATLFTDEALRHWAQEQEQFAKSVPHEDRRHRDASKMLSYAGALLALLAQPAAPALLQRMEKRRHELLREFRLEWHELKPTTEPPMAVLEAKARRQAYADTRSDIVALVQQISALRGAISSPNKTRPIHYRPVKRIR